MRLFSPAAVRAISSTWRSPITSRSGGNLPARLDHLRRDAPGLGVGRTPSTCPGLPPGRGVIVLREVVEMARPPPTTTEPQVPPLPSISETCPPGEGTGKFDDCRRPTHRGALLSLDGLRPG